MAFLEHLLIIVAALGALVALFAAPRNTLFWGATLASGYVGSADGFGGTCLGLLIGAAIGGVLAGAFSGLAWLAKPAPPKSPPPP